MQQRTSCLAAAPTALEERRELVGGIPARHAPDACPACRGTHTKYEYQYKYQTLFTLTSHDPPSSSVCSSSISSRIRSRCFLSIQIFQIITSATRPYDSHTKKAYPPMAKKSFICTPVAVAPTAFAARAPAVHCECAPAPVWQNKT